MFAVLSYLPGTVTSQQTNEPLRVLSATPSGATETRDQSHAIVVIFNKAMVPLQEVPVGEGSGPLVIEPQIKGRYRWLGTTTLTFWPNDTLPYATAYTARVPAGTKALDGSTLSQDYTWTFETPRPQLIRTLPRDNATYIRPETKIYLQFNEPMDPSRAAPYISIMKSNGTVLMTVPSQVRYPTGDELDKFGWDNLAKNILLVVPTDKLEGGSKYFVQLKAGLPGVVGNLGLAADKVITFSTPGDFKFEGLSSESIRPDGALTLVFSNPVDMKELVQHLSFSPGIEIPSEYSEGYYGTRTRTSLYLDFLPDTTYSLKIDGALKDEFGNSLGQDISVSFSTGSYTSRLYMAGGEGTIEAYGKMRYPIAVRNLESFRLRLASIPVDSVIPYFISGHFDQWVNVDRKVDLKIKNNTLSHITFKADEPLGGKKFGFIGAEISEPVPAINDFGPSSAFLQVTSLGITAKFSPENNLVWVTHLQDTKPVAGAEVQVRDDQNRVLWKGSTDTSGLATTPGWGTLGMKPKEYQQPRIWIFAREGEDWAFTRNEEGTGIDPWRFGINYDWRPQYQSLSGTVFTDRGLYRAGEEVQIKGIVRQRISDDWKLPVGRKVLVAVMDPMNEEVQTDTMTVSPFGSFDLSFEMSPNAHLGDYRIHVFTRKSGLEYGGSEYDYEDEDQKKSPEGMIEVASGSFRVEAFRPAESEVSVRFLANGTPDQPSYTMGDTARGTISARYLFGAPMRNDKVSWALRAFPGSFDPPGYPDYSFGPSWWDVERSETMLASVDTTLDDHGMLAISFPIGKDRLKGTQNLLLEATATSQSRRSVTGRASVLLHGGQFYIGIRESNFFNKLGDTLRFDLIASRPDGSLIQGEDLHVSIVKRQWISVRRAETDGRYYWQTDKIDSILQDFTVPSGSSPREGEYVPKHAGYYLINVRSTDSMGNPIESGNDFYVTGSSYIAWQRSDDDRIDLVSDRKSYKPFDVAHVMVKSPYENARALVTVERDGILRQWTTTLVGSAPDIRIPITKSDLPNIFVSVVLLQGRVAVQEVNARGEDIGRPSFKIGYINLPVDAGTQHLGVSVVTDKDNYHPGDSVEVSINVKNASGAGTAAEVVLSVADMGVLNLINYALPDPFETFFGPRELGVTTSETIVHLVQQRSYGEKGEDEGGGGMSLSEIQMRGDFRFTAYWKASIITDEKGTAKIRFKLPDNLSQFKVMAVALTMGSEFGCGTSTFRVNKEFLLQAALPRFARVGDRFSAGVLATNYSKEPGTVVLLASVDKNLILSGKDTMTFSLEPGASKEIRFDYQAPEQIGPATFNFQAAMGKFTDGLTITIPVEVPRMKESDALYESTQDSANESIIVPQDIHPGLGEIQLTAASTALGGLENSVNYLITYPYGCLEQRLSCVLPIILGEDMVKAFKLNVLEGKDMRAVAQGVIDEISRFQTGDGGFAYWKGDPYSYPYLTGYAVMVLGKAVDRGYSVDKEVLDNAVKYCSNYLRDIQNQKYVPGGEPCRLATRALIVYALACVGHPEPAYVEQLYVSRNTLPLFAKAFLLEAIHKGNGNSGAMFGMQNEITRALLNMAKFDGTTAHFEEPDWEGLKWVFSTNTRTTAIILQALLETGYRDPFLAKVTSWIMREGKIGRWRSTQENIYVVAALSDYFSAFEKENPDFTAHISIAGRKILDSMFKGREFKTVAESVPLGEFTKDKALPISIKKSGAGRLYYGIRMNYYPKRDTLYRDEGIAVLKVITTADGKPAQKSADGEYLLSAGSMYKVTITVVVAQERNFVVVDDPIPAGTETVNLTFDTESGFLSEGLDNPDEYETEYWSGGFNHVEQKDDRVLLFANTLDAGTHYHSYLVRAATYGTFSMPSTHAEEMYAPDVFGQTVHGTVIVK